MAGISLKLCYRSVRVKFGREGGHPNQAGKGGKLS